MRLAQTYQLQILRLCWWDVNKGANRGRLGPNKCAESGRASDTASDCEAELLSGRSAASEAASSVCCFQGEAPGWSWVGAAPGLLLPPHLNKSHILSGRWTEEAFVHTSHLPDAADRTSNGLKWLEVATYLSNEGR